MVKRMRNICEKCMHRIVCAYRNKGCEECNRYMADIVWCKDCEACLIDNGSRQYHLCMRSGGAFQRRVDLMDFCSFGERKKE